jgi:hypothetical protein
MEPEVRSVDLLVPLQVTICTVKTLESKSDLHDDTTQMSEVCTVYKH